MSDIFRPGLETLFYLLVKRDTNRASHSIAAGGLTVAASVYGRTEFAIEEEVWRVALDNDWIRHEADDVWLWRAGGRWHGAGVQSGKVKIAPFFTRERAK